MGNFASKGVAGTGLGLGIAGTALGLLNNNGCNGGLLGGLLGNNGNCMNRFGFGAELQYVSQLQAENAMLKSENYSDKVAKEVYMQTLVDNQKLRQDIRDELALREQIADGKIAQVTCQVANNFTATNAALACLQNTVNNITRTVIPKDAICPEVMPRFNSWTAPTAEAPASQGVVVTQGNKQ